MFERSSSAPATGTGRRHRWLLGLAAAIALLFGVVSCSGDDGGGGAGGSAVESLGSDDVDASDDSGDPNDGDAGSDDSGEGEEQGGSEGGGEGASPEQPELTAAEEAYRDELLGAIEVDDSDIDFDIECLAGRWVSRLGVDRLEAAGVTPQAFADEGPTALDLTDAEAREFVRDYERCGIDLYDFILSGELDPELRTCIIDAFGAGDLEDYLVATIVAEDEEVIALQDEITTRTAHCDE